MLVRSTSQSDRTNCRTNFELVIVTFTILRAGQKPFRELAGPAELHLENAIDYIQGWFDCRG